LSMCQGAVDLLAKVKIDLHKFKVRPRKGVPISGLKLLRIRLGKRCTLIGLA
jgi:hypothetical protein